MSEEKTVLSIQSFVTHGYVGNKSAMFLLQTHGFVVDGINTVNLSNHSGYPIIRGHRMDLQEYESLLAGICENNFLSSYRYVLLGYVNNADIIRKIGSTVTEIRKLRKKEGKKLTFFCDPVMGDDGVMYCKSEVLDAYKELVKYADVVTPNYFEAGLLSGVDVIDMASALQAVDWFHAQGVSCVVITSFRTKEDPHHLQFVFSRKRAAGLAPERFTGVVPYHEGRYTGTGDAFSALLLAFSHQSSMEEAVGKAMGVMQDVILATRQEGGDEHSTVSGRELRLTGVGRAVLNPTTKVDVRPL